MSTEKPLPAQLGEIIGGYELMRVLSHGGMGCVYQAVHTELKRPAAVKVLATALLMDEELVARFFREARIVNELQHPNIVDVFDFVELEAPRRLACVMEYIEGPTLKQVVRRKRMSVVQAINATLQLIDALRVVHSINVIHRDLKPTNIIVTGNLRTNLSEVPSVKVLDFGIAKVNEDKPGEHKTASGTMLGTPAYMAPEQVAADSVSTAADIYALGELLYEMVSGRRAFPGSRAEVLRVKMSGALPELAIPQGIRSAEAIRELVARCIVHDPKLRPTLDQLETEVGSIAALSMEDLGLEILDGEPPTDLHEMPTRPIPLVEVEEPLTKMTEVDPELREISTFDQPAPTYAVDMPPRQTRARWIAAGAGLVFALISISLTLDREAPPVTKPAPKPISIVAPVLLTPPPPPPPPPVVEEAPPPPKAAPAKVKRTPPAKAARKAPPAKSKRREKHTIQAPAVEPPPPPKEKAVQMPEW